MTRDEAIKIVHATSGGFVCTDEMANCLVNTWVALGMLKLDEPKTIKQKLDDAYGGYASLTPLGLLQQLERAGLKIVEK